MCLAYSAARKHSAYLLRNAARDNNDARYESRDSIDGDVSCCNNQHPVRILKNPPLPLSSRSKTKTIMATLLITFGALALAQGM